MGRTWLGHGAMAVRSELVSPKALRHLSVHQGNMVVHASEFGRRRTVGKYERNDGVHGTLHRET